MAILRVCFSFEYSGRSDHQRKTCALMNRPSKYLLCKKSGLFFTTTLWLLLAAIAQAEDAVPLSVKVISVAGSARYVTTNSAKGSWTALRVGDEFRAGSVLQTNSTGSTSAVVELVGPDGHGRGKVRMLSNCVLKLLRLDLKKSESGQATDVRLDVPVGKIQVRLDASSDYVFSLGAMRVTPARSVASKETAFVFAPPSSLSLVRGAVTASFGSGPEKLVRAGQDFRGDTNEITESGAVDGPDEP
jgi:hypothetical protein